MGTLTKAIAPWKVAAAVMITCSIVGYLYWNSAKEPPLHKFPVNECIRCHSDEKTVKAMIDKAGPSAQPQWEALAHEARLHGQ